MKIQTGVDIISLATITSTLGDPAQLARMLHPGDVTRPEAEHIAGRIALKEAALKALGLQAGSWLDIHIATAASGKPVISLVTDQPNLLSIDGSISHHGGTVVAFVVALYDIHE